MITDRLVGPRRGLDRDVYRSWADSTRAAGLDAGRLLAWERSTDDRYVIASAGVLSLSAAHAAHWQHIGWHQIERGGFDADTSTLRWTLYPAAAEPAGQSPVNDSIILDRPRRLPGVFRDRVNDSIAVRQFVRLHEEEPAPGRQHRPPGVIVSGRRDLSSGSPHISWHASLPTGTSWDTPGIAELAAQSLARMQAEYDPDS